MLRLPETEQSLWREDYTGPKYPALEHDTEVDVAIVGAGITGLTAGYLLKRSGLRVAVIDKDTIAGGTTGRTTGKVTAQHNLIYSSLQKRHGNAVAKSYGQANMTAMEQVAAIIQKERIECDWERADNYVFTCDPDRVAACKEEATVASSLGLPATFEPTSPLPFEIAGAVKFANQSKMNAQKYALGLARKIHGKGSYVFEKTTATSIHDGLQCAVKTRTAAIVASHIIVATNVPMFPLVARGGYCILEYPQESYIIACTLEADVAGMYISPDKQQYSILPITRGTERMLLVGGEGHLSGLRGNTTKHYERLAAYAEKHFPVSNITHRWSDRDYLAYDDIPLVGKLYPWSRNVYVATAFHKWGLTNGTAAAMILRDRIIDQANPWAHAFDSLRFKPVTSIPHAIAHYIRR